MSLPELSANAPNNLALQRYMAEPEVEMTDAGDEDTLC